MNKKYSMNLFVSIAVEVRWTSIIQSVIMNEFRARPKWAKRRPNEYNHRTILFDLFSERCYSFISFVLFEHRKQKHTHTQYMNLLDILFRILWYEPTTRRQDTLTALVKFVKHLRIFLRFFFFLWNINNWNDTLQTTNLESKSECTK